MAVRRESVVLDLDDQLTPGLIRAAAAAGVLDRELNKLDGQSTRTSRSVSKAEGEVKNLGNTAGGSSRDIDRFSGRIGLLGDALLTLGPAGVTVGAVAVPAVAALGSELGFAAVGAGTAVLAFHGLGTALTAFNKAAAAPTATNIAAAQAAMDKIPPSAQRFVLELHRLNPEMSKLRQSAAGGLFDGLTSGLRAANSDLPLARRLLSGVSTELGTLADQAGHSLASSQWRPFLKFVGNEAPQALDDMGHAAGSVAHGIAGLWMAFEPMNRGISSGLVHLAADFDHWANSVGKTKGFQDFLAYVNANGPRVLDTLGQMGITLVDVATAAAPIGGPVLDVLKSLFQIIDAIANSDFGTPLLAGLIAFRLYVRAAQMMGVQVETSFKGMAAAPAQMSAGLTSLQAKTAAWSRATVADVGTVTRAFMTAGAMSEREAAIQGGAMGRLRGTAGSALKGGALAAGIALVGSGAADSIGAANTASLALVGTLAGPWGAAVGGAVGLLLDMHSAAKDATSGQAQLDHVIASSTSTWSDYAAAIASAKSAQTSLPFSSPDSSLPQSGPGAIGPVITHPAFALSNAAHDLFGKSLVEQANDGAKAAEHLDESFSVAFTDLAAKWNSSFLAPKGGHTSTLLNDTQIGAIAERAQPAMDALGITLGDLTAAYDQGGGALDKLIGRISRWTNNADSAAGRGKAVARAFAAMSDQALTTDQRVQGLTDALDAMIDPMLNLGQAKDAFHQALNDLPQALSKSSKTLHGFSDAAIQNRGAIRGLIGDVKNQVEALAKVPGGASRASAALKAGRKAILDSATAAGLNRQQVQHMIDTMGLTPKEIRTLIRVDGADAALSAARAVSAALAAIRDRTVRITTIRTTGGRSVAGNADGGFIRGPGGPRDDVIPAMLSNGEFVVNAAATARNLSLLHSINAQKFANGGQVSATSSSNHKPDPIAHAINEHLKHFNRALADATKSLDKERQIRDSIRSAMQQQMSTVRDNFRSDFLGVDNGPWAAASNPFAILRGDIRGGRRFGRDIRDLRKRGLTAGLAGQITTLDQANQVDAMSNRQLHQLEHLFALRQRVSTRAGQADASAAFGHKLDTANHLLHQEVAEVRRLRQEVGHLRKEAAHHAKKTGDAVGKEINHASSTATRKVRRR